jgi:hypothetical protein
MLHDWRPLVFLGGFVALLGVVAFIRVRKAARTMAWVVETEDDSTTSLSLQRTSSRSGGVRGRPSRAWRRLLAGAVVDPHGVAHETTLEPT